jgi:hypothetical protein
LLTIQDRPTAQLPSSAPTDNPSTPSIGYTLLTPPNPAKASFTTSTAYERFFSLSIFTELFPHIRYYLKKRDLGRLAQVPGVFNRVATIALYNKRRLRVHDRDDHINSRDSRLLFRLDQTPSGRISKKEALEYVTNIELLEINHAIATALLTIPFPRLETLTIEGEYVLDVHRRSYTRKPTCSNLFTNKHNPVKSLAFAEAQLISHLSSYASKVELSIPAMTFGEINDTRFSGLSHRRGRQVSEHVGPWHWIPQGPQMVDWVGILATGPYSSKSPDGPNRRSLPLLPSPDSQYTLDQLGPINTLVLGIESPVTPFHRLPPAKKIEIKLEMKVFEKFNRNPVPENIPKLSIIQAILDTRAVATSTVIISIPTPPWTALTQHLLSLYPWMVSSLNQRVRRRYPYSPRDDAFAIEEEFLKHNSRDELHDLNTQLIANHIPMVIDALIERHVKTDSERQDFNQIRFDYDVDGSRDRDILMWLRKVECEYRSSSFYLHNPEISFSKPSYANNADGIRALTISRLICRNSSFTGTISVPARTYLKFKA